jgi:hypothetical protein
MVSQGMARRRKEKQRATTNYRTIKDKVSNESLFELFSSKAQVKCFSRASHLPPSCTKTLKVQKDAARYSS